MLRHCLSKTAHFNNIQGLHSRCYHYESQLPTPRLSQISQNFDIVRPAPNISEGTSYHLVSHHYKGASGISIAIDPAESLSESGVFEDRLLIAVLFILIVFLLARLGLALFIVPVVVRRHIPLLLHVEVIVLDMLEVRLLHLVVVAAAAE